MAYSKERYKKNKEKILKNNKKYFLKWYADKGKAWYREYMRKYYQDIKNGTRIRRTQDIKV